MPSIQLRLDTILMQPKEVPFVFEICDFEYNVVITVASKVDTALFLFT